MDLSVVVFLGLLAAVAILRGVELVISRRHQQMLTSGGMRKVHDPSFPWMVLVHTTILIGGAFEVVFLHRPFVPWLAAIAGALFAFANVVRWWVIWTLGSHWNVEVMNSVARGVVNTGPFRFVRHPNYAAVFVELAALPLIHTAWLTALLGSAAHAWVLSRRIAVEERVLAADATYAATMAHKPRFMPMPLVSRAQKVSARRAS